MASRVFYRFLCVCLLAFWMGGFTFYALIVVPIGNRLLGSVEQGLLTQQVTTGLNWIGIATLAVLAPTTREARWIAKSWLMMAVTLAGLFWLHPRLDVLIDGSQRVLIDEARFYRWHQVYLAISTLQWAAAVAYHWGFCNSRPEVARP